MKSLNSSTYKSHDTVIKALVSYQVIIEEKLFQERIGKYYVHLPEKYTCILMQWVSYDSYRQCQIIFTQMNF